MSITLKKDQWKVKDPSTGTYRGSAIFSTTLPEDAAQIVEDATDALDAQQVRAQEIVNNTQNAVNGINGLRETMIASIASVAGQGTDTTLTTPGVAADAAVCGDLKNTFVNETIINGKRNVVMISPDSELGNYNTSGQKTSTDTRVRSKELLFTPVDIVVVCDPNYQFVILIKSGDSYIGSGFQTRYTIPANSQFLFLGRKYPESGYTVTNVTEFASHFYIESMAFVTPEMFGAVGDGTTDDTSAVAMAFTFPFVEFRNNYCISDTITTANFHVLKGNGYSLVLKAKSAGDSISRALYIKNINNITIERVTISATKNLDATNIPSPPKVTNEKQSSWIGIFIEHCKNVVIRDCIFENLDYSIDINKGSSSQYEYTQCNKYILIENCVSIQSKNHVFACYCDDVRINNNTHILSDPTSQGFHTYYIEAFVGNVFINGDFIIAIDVGSQYTPYDFQSVLGLGENRFREIIVDNFYVSCCQLLVTSYSQNKILLKNGVVQIKSISDYSVMGYFTNQTSNIVFENIEFSNLNERPVYISNSLPSDATGEIIVRKCTFTDLYPMINGLADSQVVNRMVIDSCKFIWKHNTEREAIHLPSVGYAKITNSEFYDTVGYLTAFVGGKDNVAVDSDSKIINCIFESAGQGVFTSDFSLTGTLSLANCIINTESEQSSPFGTEPTNSVFVAYNYNLVS